MNGLQRHIRCPFNTSIGSGPTDAFRIAGYSIEIDALESRKGPEMDFVLCAVGLVLVIEGIPYFAFPEKMKQALAKIPLLPTPVMRVFGMAAIAGGLILIYISRRLLS